MEDSVIIAILIAIEVTSQEQMFSDMQVISSNFMYLFYRYICPSGKWRHIVIHCHYLHLKINLNHLGTG